MAAIKITSFAGKAPVRASELLPDTAAQIAKNCKLVSGNLVPYREKSTAGLTGYNVTVRSLYALRNPDDSLAFLAWPQIVNIATPTVVTNPQEQRYFFSDSQGPPRVSDYSLSVNLLSPPPYPLDSYLLGLPIPTARLTTAPNAIPVASLSTIARTANTVTIVTTSAHGFSTGTFIKITGIPNLLGTYSQTTTTVTVTLTAHGFTSGDLIPLELISTVGGSPVSGTYTITVTGVNTFDATVPNSATDSGTVAISRASFQADGVRIAYVNSTTFTFFSPGSFSYAATSVTGATATISGADGIRFYNYTWTSDLGEESIPAQPSLDTLAREGQSVVVSNIPTAPPAGDYNVRGVRLYRTVAGTTESEFLRLQTLWFPTEITGGGRLSNVSTVQTRSKHMLQVGDRFQISGIVADASFNITNGVVTAVVDNRTIRYNQLGSDVPGFIEASGNGELYYDAAQNKDSPAVYWTGSTFTDDYDASILFTPLPSDRYAAPPVNLKGLVAISNGILAGFVENRVYFSEPSFPHAWPVEYEITLESKIVALSSLGGSLLVLTEGYPYLISGSKPAVMDDRRMDSLYPCVSASSVVSANSGVMYASHDGIIQIRTDQGPIVLTKALYDADVWNEEFDPSTIVAAYYDESYVASHSTGAFVFEPNEQGGTFITHDEAFTSVWYDAREDTVYFTKANDATVYRWDDPAQNPLTMEWKSKTFLLEDYVNFGAARIRADYVQLQNNPASAALLDDNNYTSLMDDDGIIELADDTLPPPPPAIDSTITFRMWVNKQLTFTHAVTNDQPFRLPTGYRSDTFEFGVETKLRLRAIHVAETVSGLKAV